MHLEFLRGQLKQENENVRHIFAACSARFQFLLKTAAVLLRQAKKI